MQLASALRLSGVPMREPVIVARTGWTTAELLSATERVPSAEWDIVTLLIGVNDQYRGVAVDDYRTTFRIVLERAIALAGGEPSRTLVISIPDWGVTPFATGRDRALIARQIDEFNDVNRAEAARAGTPYADVTALTRRVVDDSTSVAADGLHPSARAYATWVDALLPAVKKILGAA